LPWVEKDQNPCWKNVWGQSPEVWTRNKKQTKGGRHDYLQRRAKKADSATRGVWGAVKSHRGEIVEKNKREKRELAGLGSLRGGKNPKGTVAKDMQSGKKRKEPGQWGGGGGTKNGEISVQGKAKSVGRRKKVKHCTP